MRAAEDCAATSSLSRKRSTDDSLPFLAHGSETSLPVTPAAGVSLLTPNQRMERTGPPMIGWRCNGNQCWPNVSKTTVFDPKRSRSDCSLLLRSNRDQATGQLVFHIFGALAEFERDIIRTTQLYNRRPNDISLDEVERIGCKRCPRQPYLSSLRGL